MKILDGKKLSQKILEDLKKEIKAKQLRLKLAVVLVGHDLSSQVYVKKKQEACKKIGIGFELFKFSSKISQIRLREEIKKIAEKPDISGIIIQLPLPKGLGDQEFLDFIPLEKDIDLLSKKNMDKYHAGDLSILPPTIEGIRCLLEEYNIMIKGKKIVVIGAGRLVGKPLVPWLLKEKAIIFVVDKSFKDISSFTKKADIIISGVGSPNLIKGDIVKDGVVIIDAGTSFEKGKLAGDIDFKSVAEKTSYITPVPGGVGPMTVACLLKNLVKFSTK